MSASATWDGSHWPLPICSSAIPPRTATRSRANAAAAPTSLPADRRLLGSANDVVDIRTQPASAPTWVGTIAVDLLYYRLSAVILLAPGSRPSSAARDCSRRAESSRYG